MKTSKPIALLATLGLTLCACMSGENPSPTPALSSSPPTSISPSAPTAISTPPPTPEGVSIQERDGRPIGVANVNGDTWYALAGKDSVAHPSGETSVGRIPLRLAPGPDGVWVSVFGAGAVTLLGFDGAIVTTVNLGTTAEPEGLAVDGETLWVVDQSADAVLALDTTTNEVITSLPVGNGPRLVAIGANDVWLSTYGTGGITAIDRTSKLRRTSRLNVCRGVQGLAEASGVLWVACTTDDAIVALNSKDLSELTRIDLEDADAITTDGKRVIAVGQAGPTVVQIDPATQHEQRRTVLSDAEAVSDGNIDATIIGDEVVITHPDTNRVYRLQLP